MSFMGIKISLILKDKIDSFEYKIVINFQWIGM